MAVSTPDEQGPVPEAGSELLDRATAELRAAPEREPTWQDISDSVVGALRAVTRRTTWVSAGLDPRSGTGLTGTGPVDTVAVSDQALAALVRHALRPVPGCDPAGLEIGVDEAGRCTGLTVEVVAAYGQDLLALAAEVRRRCTVVLLDALGEDAAPPAASVAVQVVDVTEGDPRA